MTLIKPRRWAAKYRRAKLGSLTEGYVSIHEAMSALNALVLQIGLAIIDVYDYDPRRDEFTVKCAKANGGVTDCFIMGDTVAAVVKAMRGLVANGEGLKIYHERAAASGTNHAR